MTALIAALSELYDSKTIRAIADGYIARTPKPTPIGLLVEISRKLPAATATAGVGGLPAARVTLLEQLLLILRDPGRMQIWNTTPAEVRAAIEREAGEALRGLTGSRDPDATFHIQLQLIAILRAATDSPPVAESFERAFRETLDKHQQFIVSTMGRAPPDSAASIAQREDSALVAIAAHLGRAGLSGTGSDNAIRLARARILWEEATALASTDRARAAKFFAAAARAYLAAGNLINAQAAANQALSFARGEQNAPRLAAYIVLAELQGRLLAQPQYSDADRRVFTLPDDPAAARAAIAKRLAESDAEVLRIGKNDPSHSLPLLLAALRTAQRNHAEGKDAETLKLFAELEPVLGRSPLFLARQALVEILADPRIKSWNEYIARLEEAAKTDQDARARLVRIRVNEKEILALIGSGIQETGLTSDEQRKVFNLVDVALNAAAGVAADTNARSEIDMTRVRLGVIYLEFLRNHRAAWTRDEADRVIGNLQVHLNRLGPAGGASLGTLPQWLEEYRASEGKREATLARLKRGGITDEREIMLVISEAFRARDLDLVDAAMARFAALDGLEGAKRIRRLIAIVRMVGSILRDGAPAADQADRLAKLRDTALRELNIHLETEIAAGKTALFEAYGELAKLPPHPSTEEAQNRYAAAAKKRDEAYERIRVNERIRAEVSVAGLAANEARDRLKAGIDTAVATEKEATNRAINAYEKAGDALTDDETTRKGLHTQFAAIAIARANRDAARDALIRLFPDLLPEERRSGGPTSRGGREIGEVFNEINGYLGIDGAEDDVRRNGAVQSLNYYSGWARYSNDAAEKKSAGFWEAFYREKLNNLQARRRTLVFEMPGLDPSERIKRYRDEIHREAGYWKDFSDKLTAGIFTELTGVGEREKAYAEEIKARLRFQTTPDLINRLVETADQNGDPQKFFNLLVSLNIEKMTAGAEAWREYVNTPRWKRGLSQVYYLYYSNLFGGTRWNAREVAARIQAEQSKIAALNSALIEAAARSVSRIDPKNRKLLEERGFIVNGKYVIPRNFRYNPATEGDTAAQRTWIDEIVNVGSLVEALGTVVIPGGFAARGAEAIFGRVALEAGAAKALAHSGAKLATESLLFTGYSRAGQVFFNPMLLMDENAWTAESLLREYGHTVAMLGTIKLSGKAMDRLGEAVTARVRPTFTTEEIFALPLSQLRHVPVKDLSLAVLGASSKFAGEGLVFTGVEAALSGHAPGSRGSTPFAQNLLRNLVFLAELKAGGGLVNLRALRERASPGPQAEVSQSARAHERTWKAYQELVDIIRPSEVLMEKYGGSWDAIRNAYQKGEIAEGDMRKVFDARKKIIDELAAEILAEIKATHGEHSVNAFGSSNLTSDYDLSFVGPKAELAVMIFNARFGARWGRAAQIGGKESATRLDVNFYTDPVFDQFKAGVGDVMEQYVAAHMAGRKYMTEAQWKAHVESVLKATPEAERPAMKEALDKARREADAANRAIEELEAEIRKVAGADADPTDIAWAARNRLYEDALREIIDLKDAYDAARLSVTRRRIAQEARNAQSKALYFAAEAYQTEAAIKHVVFTIQAAGRKITVESLLSNERPNLSIPLTEAQGRHSMIEQIANIYKELNHEARGAGHHGPPVKLSGKTAKYFIRALDAAKIAGLDLTSYREIVEATVEIDANRADVAKVAEILTRRFGPEQSSGGEKYMKAVEAAMKRLVESPLGLSVEPAPDVVAAEKTSLNDLSERVLVSMGLDPLPAAPVSPEAAPVRGPPGREKPRELTEIDPAGGGEVVGIGGYGEVFRSTRNPAEVVKKIWVQVKNARTVEAVSEQLSLIYRSVLREIQGAGLLKKAGLDHVEITGQGVTAYNHPQAGEVTIPCLAKPYIGEGMIINGKPAAGAVILDVWMERNGYRTKSSDGDYVNKPLPTEIQDLMIDYVHRANAAGIYLSDFKPQNLIIYKTASDGKWRLALLETDGVYRATDAHLREVFHLEPGMTPQEIARTLATVEQMQGQFAFGPPVEAQTAGQLRNIFDPGHVARLRDFTASGLTANFAPIEALDLTASNFLQPSVLDAYLKYGGEMSGLQR